jgi:hypothetical protein
MAFNMQGNGLMSLLNVKAPLAQTSDGGYALTIGVEALNAGIQLGGRTGLEVFAEAGPLYAKAGLDMNVNAYAIAGIQSVVEVGAVAGLSAGAGAYVANLKNGNIHGVAWTSGGLGSFSYDGATQTLSKASGQEAAVTGAVGLVGALAQFGGPSSVYVPNITESLQQLGMVSGGTA